MGSRFLRQSIATVLAIGALWSSDVLACPIWDSCRDDEEPVVVDPVIVTAPVYPDFPDPPRDTDPFDPWDGGDNDGGGGGGPEPYCPEPPGGNSLLPSLKHTSCPNLSCDALLLAKPNDCASRISKPSSWNEGIAHLRAGSPMARLTAFADESTATGRLLDAVPRYTIIRALTSFNGAGPFASLSDTRRALSNAVQSACDQQRQVQWGHQGWRVCVDIAAEIHREAIDDPGFLSYLLNQINHQGFEIPLSRYSPITWTPGPNSLATHHQYLEMLHACARWWELNDELRCGSN